MNREGWISFAAVVLACGGCAGEPSEPTPAPPAECVYPAGSFGVEEGQVVPAVFAWEGFAPGAVEPSLIEVADSFDCDGTRGIDALLFDSSAAGCEGCVTEAASFEGRFDEWRSLDLRIRVVTLLVQGEHGVPTMDTVITWKNMFELQSIYLVLDTSSSMVPSGNGLPVLTVVDPRTMQVVRVQRGFSGTFPAELETLARSNHPE